MGFQLHNSPVPIYFTILIKDTDNLLHKITRTKKHHHKYLCMIVLTILLLDLQMHFMNYDSVFRCYGPVFND